MRVPSAVMYPRVALLTACCLSLLIHSGCSRRQDGPPRYDVKGTVTYKGEPLEAGRITFAPDHTKENRGPVGYAEVKHGKYDTSIRGSKGAVSGPLIVYITGYDYSGAANEELRPPLFVDFEEHAEIDPEADRFTFDFAVPDQSGKRKPL